MATTARRSSPLLLLLLSAIAASQGDDRVVTEQCLHCLCLANFCDMEKVCVEGTPNCGPFQISKPFWVDGYKPVIPGDLPSDLLGNAVAKRWGNLRDAFSRSKRKLKECKKSGSGASNIKKYVYADQMQFLNKVYESREVADSLDNSNVIKDDADTDDGQPQPSFVEDIESLSHHRKEINSNGKNTGHRKRRHPDEIELKMLKALEQPQPSAHMLFFQGLLPHLNKFDDGEVLEFQMGVLQLISQINDKKKNSQPLPPQTHAYYHQNYPQPQAASFLHPQPSHSNQFNSNSFQAQFSQIHQFHNPELLNYSTNHQRCSSKTKTPDFQQEQTTTQFYKQGQSSAVSPPDSYPAESPSSSASLSTDTTYDFS